MFQHVHVYISLAYVCVFMCIYRHNGVGQTLAFVCKRVWILDRVEKLTLGICFVKYKRSHNGTCTITYVKIKTGVCVCVFVLLFVFVIYLINF